MQKATRKQRIAEQTKRDCALIAELFSLCCNSCDDLLISIVGNCPTGRFRGVRDSMFDRSSLFTEATVDNALSCFRPVILKTIAKNPSMCQESRFNGHDALFYIQVLKFMWQTAFSALKRTLSAPKSLIVSEHAMAKALAEIEYLYRNGEKRYSCEDVRDSFQEFLKTLPDLATALAQHDYINPFGGIGSRTVRADWKMSNTAKVAELPTGGERFPRLSEGANRKELKCDAKSEYSISDENYRDIIKVIKNTAMTWERTPNSYRYMGEEDLRNALLGSLNCRFPGKANGETFRKNGKTDICIEAEDRTAFVAECKIWTGKGNVPAALAQLDSYLTWRDGKTALVYFVKRKGFLAIADRMKNVLTRQKDLLGIRALARNEFACQMSSACTPGHTINIRVLLFNLHSDEDKKGASKNGATRQRIKGREEPDP